MPPRPLRRAAVLLVAAGLAAACGEEMPQAPADRPASGARDATAPSFSVTEAARDSALAQAESVSAPERSGGGALDASVQATAAGAVQIFEGDRAVVTVAGASTARGEQVAVRGVIDALLFPCVGGCGTSESDNVGATTTIGPAPEDGTLQFVLPLAAGGTGESRVLGSYPSYTIRMDDGIFDSDFNDVILTVDIQPAEDECDFFDESVSDPLLQNDEIQKALHDLFEQSNPDAADVRDQVEMAGYIVERDGQLEFIPASSNQDPQMCRSEFKPGDIPEDVTLEGFVHTHPHTPGDPVPSDGSCAGRTRGVFGNGPSLADIEAARNSPVSTYIVDRDEVHRLPPHFENPRFGTGESPAQFERNPQADCP